MPEDSENARHHETSLIRAFVQSHRKERLLHLLESKGGRRKLQRLLPHFSYLDERFARLIPAGEQSASAIAGLLRANGAPERCYVMSGDAQLDGRWTQLEDALHHACLGAGTFVSCIPGRLAYFEAETVGVRYVLQREPST